MLTLAAPGFLLAGILGMLVPLALHLIRRRPPQRAALPTARFLSADPRNAVRVSRPTDVPLLILRMLLLLLLGAALARPAWIPARAGTGTVVLLDRGASSRTEWPRAVAAAAEAVMGPEGEPRGELVLFDSTARHVPRAQLNADFFAALTRGGATTARSDLAAALRAIPPAARGLRGADSVSVRWISAFPQSGWSSGLAPLRRAAWPGRVEMVPLRVGADSAVADSARSRRAAVVAADGGRYAAAALGALGYAARTVAPGAASSLPEDVIVVLDAPAAAQPPLMDRARAGATVVFSARAAEAVDGLPWRPSAGAPGAGTMWFGPELRLGGAAGRAGGTPATDARIVAAWDDGRPAAVSRRLGRGCVVVAGTALEGGELPLQAEYPAALGRLARGCEDEPRTADRPLDSGALSLLRGSGPGVIPASRLGAAEGGLAFGRWLLAAALLVALLETLLAYRRRTAA
ncbi:MAG TPA: BatA domain-containing protein [Longimicrobium sp.]|uniref:BatA domain-containing protein n=1 Tax=Longimicrobium sp. TaxID=2029185 RepID=UPI002ED9C0F3